MSTTRADYLALASDVLDWLELGDDLVERVAALDEDPLDLGVKIRGLAVKAASPEAKPTELNGASGVVPSGQAGRDGTLKSGMHSGEVERIVQQLVRDNPGRTLGQLKAANQALVRRVHEESVSATLSQLASTGQIVRAICDTERQFKYYEFGAVPRFVKVFDRDFRWLSRKGGYQELQRRARQPTPAEMGVAE